MREVQTFSGSSYGQPPWPRPNTLKMAPTDNLSTAPVAPHQNYRRLEVRGLKLDPDNRVVAVYYSYFDFDPQTTKRPNKSSLLDIQFKQFDF
ncbi:hypothetical protein AWZ03_009770 [Drosophila navojoa]|uniref:Uncharacterized protein n=1 Tax=Drosophila navojoa TaxID=7232 RepID=A0A484B6X3_DRONA|nr:hypothetical protein AWZ03_009770 [Drosophila navojoa]